jgi:hypothetical protein
MVAGRLRRAANDRLLAEGIGEKTQVSSGTATRDAEVE